MFICNFTSKQKTMCNFFINFRISCEMFASSCGCVKFLSIFFSVSVSDKAWEEWASNSSFRFFIEILSIPNLSGWYWANPQNLMHPLHKKWSFPLRISSVNVTKSAGKCAFGNIYWRNLNGKLHFLCSDRTHKLWDLLQYFFPFQ